MELLYEVGPLAAIPITFGGLFLWSRYKRRCGCGGDEEQVEDDGGENGEGTDLPEEQRQHQQQEGYESTEVVPMYGSPVEGIVYGNGGGGYGMYPPPPGGGGIVDPPLYQQPAQEGYATGQHQVIGLYPPPPPPPPLGTTSPNPPAIPESCWVPPSSEERL